MRLAGSLLLVMMACGCGGGNAAGLSDALDAAANGMTINHESTRTVTFERRSRKPYWVALVPPDSSPTVFDGNPSPYASREFLRHCLEGSPRSVLVILSDADETQCVSHDRISVARPLMANKGAEQKTTITIIADQSGFRAERLQ